LIGDLIPAVVSQWSPDSILADRAFIMGMVVLFCMLPPSLAKKMDFLRHTSLIALACMVYCFFLVSGWAIKTNFDDRERGNVNDEPLGSHWPTGINVSTDIFFALPIIAFAFSSHVQVYQIYRETGQKNIPRMMSVVHMSVGTCLVLYLAVGVFGYLTFYSVTDGNVLNNYTDEDNAFVALGKVGLAITLTFSSPLFVPPLRQTIGGLLLSPDKLAKFNWARHIGGTVAILGTTLLLAVFVPDVANVLALTGATCSTSVMYLFPAAFYLRCERYLSDIDSPAAKQRHRMSILILVWGLVMSVLGTVVSIIDFAS
jgi:amino acid permease